MAIHSRTSAWKIPWTEEPGRLQSMGSQRVGLSDFTFTFTPPKQSSSKDVQGMKITLVLMGIHGRDRIKFVFLQDESLFLFLSVHRGQHFLDEAVLLLSPFFFSLCSHSTPPAEDLGWLGHQGSTLIYWASCYRTITHWYFSPEPSISFCP